MDFKDPASGQFMIAALNNLQAQVAAGGAITPQPWFENQIGPTILANLGGNCNQFGLGANCTELVANLLHDLVLQGGTADTIHSLAGLGILPPNVGLASQFGVSRTSLTSSRARRLLVSLRTRFSQGSSSRPLHLSNSRDNLSRSPRQW